MKCDFHVSFSAKFANYLGGSPSRNTVSGDQKS